MSESHRHFKSDADSFRAVRALLTVNELFSHVYNRLELLNRWQIPATGPAILVCNHISGIDPLIIQSVSPRVIIWMMAREYYDIKLTHWVFRRAESIPVERTGRDLASTRSAMRALEAGRVLGVFPEGKIESEGRELLPFQTGVALMSIKTHVPVYPAYIDGTSRGRSMLPAFLIPNRIRLAFGPPVSLQGFATDRESLDRATQRIVDAIETLKRQSDLQPR